MANVPAHAVDRHVCFYNSMVVPERLVGDVNDSSPMKASA